MKELVQAYFDEARWLHDDYTPTMDEYMSVATVSATYFFISTTTFVGMGEIATEVVFQWVSNKPKIVTASSVIGRLMNDIISHKNHPLFQGKIDIGLDEYAFHRLK